jgi:hypothetical protein
VNLVVVVYATMIVEAIDVVMITPTILLLPVRKWIRIMRSVEPLLLPAETLNPKGSLLRQLSALLQLQQKLLRKSRPILSSVLMNWLATAIPVKLPGKIFPRTSW